MDKNVLIRNIFSGIFFIGGIILILVIVFMIGKDRGFAQPKFKVAVLFRDIGGLIEGAPVQLAGVNVGTVSDISFLDQKIDGRRVKVEVNIFNRYKRQLSHEIRFSIKTEGILGEKLIEIHSGESGQQVDFSQPIIGKDPLNVQDMAQVFSNAAESFTNTSEEFSKVDVQELSIALSETAQSLSQTSKGISEMLTEMRYISIKSKRLLNRLEQRVIDGDLFKVF